MGNATWSAPSLRFNGKLWPRFDEDEITLAAQVAAAHGLMPGDAVAVHGLELPAWWWQGTGLVNDPDARLVLRRLPSTAGILVGCHDAGQRFDLRGLELQALGHGTPIEAEMHALLQAARDGPDTEADYPLGAYVLPARHDAVLVDRMRMGPGTVRSWTTIGAGAAPTEFFRLQQAQGAYHVALVELDGGGRTVGIWAGGEAPSAGQRCHPALRRLFRTQGAWRYGVKWVPG